MTVELQLHLCWKGLSIWFSIFFSPFSLHESDESHRDKVTVSTGSQLDTLDKKEKQSSRNMATPVNWRVTRGEWESGEKRPDTKELEGSAVSRCQRKTDWHTPPRSAAALILPWSGPSKKKISSHSLPVNMEKLTLSPQMLSMKDATQRKRRKEPLSPLTVSYSPTVVQTVECVTGKRKRNFCKEPYVSHAKDTWVQMHPRKLEKTCIQGKHCCSCLNRQTFFFPLLL